MIALEFETPAEMAQAIARRCREKRLVLNLSQKSLSQRSAVSASVIKQFETTGKIALGSLLKIALALGSMSDFREIFKNNPVQNSLTLDQILNPPLPRKRGRQ